MRRGAPGDERRAAVPMPRFGRPPTCWATAASAPEEAEAAAYHVAQNTPPPFGYSGLVRQHRAQRRALDTAADISLCVSLDNDYFEYKA